MARTKSAKRDADYEASTESPSPPHLTRPKRVKHIPNRFHHGIFKQILGIPSSHTSSPKPKGISIQEPSKTESKRASKPVHEDPNGKQQEGVPPPPRKKLRAHKGEGSSKSAFNPFQSSQNPTIVPNALSEIYNHVSAPPGFITDSHILTGERAEQFQETYKQKSFCPIVSVDLYKIRETCNIDLSPWLKPYESFLSISAQFSNYVTKMFYFNME